MDKATVLLAEKVGEFLLPVIKRLLDEQAAAHERELKSLTEAHATAVGSMEGDFKSLCAQVDALAKGVRTFETDLQKMHTRYVEGTNSLQGGYDELRDELTNVQAKLDTSMKQLGEGLDALSAHVDKAVITLRSQVDATESSVARLVDTHAEDVEKLLSRLADVNKHCGNIVETNGVNYAAGQKRFAELAGRITAVEEKQSAAASSINSLSESLDAVQSKVNDVVAATAEQAEELRGVASENVKGFYEVSVKSLETLARLIGDRVDTLEKSSVGILDQIGTHSESISAVTDSVTELKSNLSEQVKTTVDETLPAIVSEHIVHLNAAVVERVKEAVAAIEIPTPKDGRDGRDGKDGKDGKDGRDGINGKDGTVGKDGRDGVDGKDGKDGTFGEITKYVPGLVYAPHALVVARGGVWQAVQSTVEPVAADSPYWRCIVPGVADMQFDTEDEGRFFTMSVELSNGIKVDTRAESSMLLYRGVYSDDGEYAKGDAVTQNGSVWVAKGPTSSKPGTADNPDWVLAVKRGQDGRSGKDGADGAWFTAGFAGEYELGKAYPKDAVVTYASSTWMAKRPTKETPPYMTLESNEHWLRLR